MENRNLKETALMAYDDKEIKRMDIIGNAFSEKFGICSDLQRTKMSGKFAMAFDFLDFTIWGFMNRKEEITFHFSCAEYIRYPEIKTLEDLGQFIHTYIVMRKPEFPYNNPAWY